MSVGYFSGVDIKPKVIAVFRLIDQNGHERFEPSVSGNLTFTIRHFYGLLRGSSMVVHQFDDRVFSLVALGSARLIPLHTLYLGQKWSSDTAVSRVTTDTSAYSSYNITAVL